MASNNTDPKKLSSASDAPMSAEIDSKRSRYLVAIAPITEMANDPEIQRAIEEEFPETKMDALLN